MATKSKPVKPTEPEVPTDADRAAMRKLFDGSLSYNMHPVVASAFRTEVYQFLMHLGGKWEILAAEWAEIT